MPDGRVFRFTRLPSRRGVVFRPLITATLTGPAGSLETEMLLDSGADTSIIDLRMAERIGLDLGPIEMMAGIGADIPGHGGKALLRVERIPPEVPAVALPVFMPVDRELPSFPILGRAAFFEAFDVLLEMGPIPSRGTFSVSPHS